MCDGPSLQDGGFFYELNLPSGLSVTEKDMQQLLSIMKQIAKQRQPFERLEVEENVHYDEFLKFKVGWHFVI